jgi:hypothetical protein
MLNRDKAIAELERLLFLKITQFVGIAWNDKQEYCEIISIDPEKRLAAVGAAHIMTRGLETICDIAEVGCMMNLCRCDE